VACLVATWWPSAADVAPRLSPSARLILCLYDEVSYRSQERAWVALARRAECVAVCSPSLRRLMDRAGLRTIYQPDGVDGEVFRAAASPGKRARPVLGWVGDPAVAAKNYRLVRDLQTRTDVEIRVATDVPHERMPSWYADTDGILCLSTSEGTPNPILEGCACGLPYVSTAVGLVPGIHEATGGGILIPEMTETRYAHRAVDEWLASRKRWAGWGAANAALMRQRYAWDLGPLREAARAGEAKAPEKPARSERRAVAVVVDRPGWAFDRIAHRIAACLGWAADIDVLYYPRLTPGGLDGYDAVLSMGYHGAAELLAVLPSSTPLGLAVYDHEHWRATPSLAAMLRDLSGRASHAWAANARLASQLSAELGRPVETCEDGVDVDAFAASPVHGGKRPLRVGWAGNSETQAAIKRLDVIREAVESVSGATLVLADAATDPIPHEQMAAWYVGIDVIVCASTSEGTPNPILEAASCGRGWVSTSVGIVPDLMEQSSGEGGVVFDGTSHGLAAALRPLAKDRARVAAMGAAARTTIETGRWDWPHRVRAFLPIVAPGVDDSVTVVLVTSGHEHAARAEAAIRAQTYRTRVEIVRDVTPMDAAFRAMQAAAAGSDLYVQVDDDMILTPDAVGRMVRWMRDEATPETWMAAWPLHDEHLREPVIGCKVYRTELAARYPWQPSLSCEMGQIERALRDGYRIAVHELTDPPVGTHEIGTDPRTVFERYLRLARKGRRFGYAWVRRVPRSFGDTPRDRVALAGWCAGWWGRDDDRGERDASQPEPEWTEWASLGGT